MSSQDLPSDTSPRASRRPPVLVGEKVTPDPTTSRSSSESLSATIQRATQPTSPSLPQEYVHRAAWRAGVLGAVNVFTMILAARLLVLVAIGGAIALTWYALEQPDLYRLVALGIYCSLVVVPSIVLAAMGR